MRVVALALLALSCACADIHAAAAAQPPAPVPNLIGLTRGDAIRTLGKPQSTLQRGNREILVYASGARVEIVNDEIVAFRATQESVLVSSDGTQYRASDSGRVERISPEPEPEPDPELEPDPEVAAPSAPEGEATVAPPVADSPPPASEEPSEEFDPEVDSMIPSDGESGPPVDLEGTIPGTKTTLEGYLDTGKIEIDEPPPAPPATRAVGVIIGMVLRLVLAASIIGLTLKWLGLPFYLPDLIKVGLFYVLVRDGLAGLGSLGGMWEMLLFFRVPDGVGFFALAIALYRFGVVRNGLTALKVAAGTTVATYMLMIVLGIAITFALMALQ